MLEARFHPATKARARFVVLGRVICHQNRASIEHVEVAPNAVMPFQAARLHARLEVLVESLVDDHAEALVAIESGYWSFVEMAKGRDPGGTA